MDVPHQSILAAYNNVEHQLKSFLDGIPLETPHLLVWSPVLAPIILEAASQLDSLWKLQLTAAGSNNAADAKIIDYFTSFGSAVAKKSLVIWSDGGHKFIPFTPWHTMTTFDGKHYVPLPWWQAYNALKHDRWKNKREATIKNAIFAIGGLFLAIVHSPLMKDGLIESGWLHTGWNREIVIENLNDNSTTKRTEATFETPLLSFAVEHGPTPCSVRIYEGTATPRFYHWLAANYRKQVPVL